jgi:hypothetical protein
VSRRNGTEPDYDKDGRTNKAEPDENVVKANGVGPDAIEQQTNEDKTTRWK